MCFVYRFSLLPRNFTQRFVLEIGRDSCAFLIRLHRAREGVVLSKNPRRRVSAFSTAQSWNPFWKAFSEPSLPFKPITRQTFKKPSRKQSREPSKTPIFWQISGFFNLHTFISAKLCFAENTIKIVFSAESLRASQIAKTPFKAPSQNGTSATKVLFLGFPLCLLKPLFYSVWWFLWSQKKYHFQKQIVATKMHVFDLPNTNNVCLFFLLKKCHFSQKQCSQPLNKQKHLGPIFDNLGPIFDSTKNQFLDQFWLQRRRPHWTPTLLSV